MFLIAPTACLLVGAFQDREGAFTLGNIATAQPAVDPLSYWLSLKVSAASAALGALFGLALALAALHGGLPSWLRPTLMTFSGVASNFAGVPLAFAFMATLGRLGLVTVLLRNVGFDLYAHGFNILTFWGLTITYLYFQIPLMVLVVTPAIDGLKSRVGGGGGDARREFLAILAPDRAADPVAEHHRRRLAAVRQRVRRHRDGLRAHRLLVQHRADPALRPDPRRRAARSQSRLCARARHAGDHRRLEPRLSRLARPLRPMAPMKRGHPGAWVAVALGGLYFLAPLVATFEFSLRMRRGVYSFDAYRVVFASGNFQASFLYSTVVALVTIVVAALIVVPAAYFVQLRLPRLRGIVEFITLLPLVIPAIVLVFGFIRLYGSSSVLPLTATSLGADALLTFGYVGLGLPYMYRAVDTGLRAIDVRTLTEAAESQGAGAVTILFRVILPNIRSAILSGAFLTFAIVIGEFTFASLLDRPAFGPYLQLIGASRAYEPSALAVMAFALTWACLGLMQARRRRSGRRRQALGRPRCRFSL